MGPSPDTGQNSPKPRLDAHQYPPAPAAPAPGDEAEKLLPRANSHRERADDAEAIHFGDLNPSPAFLRSRHSWWQPWRSPSAQYALLGPEPHTHAPSRGRTRGRGRKRILAIGAAVLFAVTFAMVHLKNTPSPHATSPASSAAPPSAHALLGDYLTSPKLVLSDPYRLAHLSVDPDTIDAPDLDLGRLGAHSLGGALPLGPGPDAQVDPSAVYTPQWAAESKLTPVPAYSVITENDDCLLQWVSEGMICPEVRAQYGAQPSTAPPHLPPIDIVFTWVNGSDPLHEQAKQFWAYCMTAYSAAERDTYCPQPYIAGEDGTQTLSPHAQDEYRTKLDRFLRDVYPLLRQAETGQRDTDYLARRNRERKLGLSFSRFFEMNELRYAIRTAVQFISRLGTVHLISPDYPLWSLELMARSEALRTGRTPEQVLAERNSTLDMYTDPFDGSQRVGQRPVWIDADSPSVLTGARAIDQATHTKGPLLRLHHDWSFFRPLGPPPARADQAQVHSQKLALLPTFNSMAVESAFDPSLPPASGGLKGSSDTMLVSNDDFFLMRPVGHHDIHSPLYGLVFRFQHDLGVDAAGQISWSTGGEWPGLRFVSHVLDRRFGARHRRYPLHVHRGVSASLVHETHLLFREEIAAGMRARFRGVGKNVVMHFLFFNTVMERHREAALWSYIMFNLDANQDGVVDYDEFQALRRTFRRHHTGARDTDDPVTAETAYRAAHPGWATEEPTRSRSADRVLTPRRSTLVESEVHKRHAAVGLKSDTAASVYRFSSWDGFGLSDLYSNAVNVFGMNTLGKHMWWHGAGWPWFILDPQRQAEQHKSQALAEAEKLKHLAAAAAAAAASAAAAQGEYVPPTAASTGAATATAGPAQGTVKSTTLVDDGPARSPHEEDQDPRGDVACQIEWKSCLAGAAQEWMLRDTDEARAFRQPAEEFFTNMAFANSHCGDCLLTHLVQRSGPHGLRAVLPPANVRLPGNPSAAPAEEPHLPLGRVWQADERRGCNFSVASVTASLGWGGRSARLMVARMLQRYAYTVGATPAEFVKLGAGGVSHTRSLLRTMLSHVRTDRAPFAPETTKAEEVDHESLAMLAVNDDIQDHIKSHAIVTTFVRWLEETFPAAVWKTPFER